MTIAAALILNVDDNEAARFARSRVLRSAGFDVIESATGEDALAMIHTRTPSLVVLDVKLPDIDGIHVCRLIKANPLTASVLVLQVSAAAVRPSDRTYALNNGADSYLTLPVEPVELVANVRALLRLRFAEDALREADDRKNRFLAILAHELRNPLAPIRNAAELLDRKYPVGAHQVTAARTMLIRQIAHFTRLVDDLLDVSRITHGKMTLDIQRVDVEGAISTAIEAARPLVDSRRHSLSVRFPDRTCVVPGDRVRIAQIVTNLLSNAAKYTPDGGQIVLELSASGDRLKICVRDNGIGISATELPDVFNLFMQSKNPAVRTQDGLGIGLCLVKTLTEMLGGNVTAHSAGLNQGAQFNVDLPLYVEGESTSGVLPIQSGKIDSTYVEPRSILIVDDNRDGAQSLSMLMKASGHDVQVALNGSDALKIAAAFQPEVIILDIGMPEMDGYAVARALRADLCASKALLIALTGFGQKEDTACSQKAGFDHHLVKPVEFSTLQSMIRLHFGRR